MAVANGNIRSQAIKHKLMNTGNNNDLVDSFGRKHESLRVSVTDRCNIRCFYCMPLENVTFLPRSQVLSFEEISRVVDVAIGLGIKKIRLTGGEPLVRKDLPRLIEILATKSGVEDLALTTNGILLADQAQALRDAGLRRINVSLDTLKEETFRKISRRDGLATILAGIAAARNAGFKEIRINAIAIKDVNENEIVTLAQFCREHDLHLRFIEFMPLDADKKWDLEQVVTGAAVRNKISNELCNLIAETSADPSQPAKDYRYSDGRQSVGFINTLSEPFCGSCNRLRLTAEGQFRNCLFGTQDWDARAILRGNGSDAELVALLQDCVANKKAGHGIDDPSFIRPNKSMYQIGG